MVTLYVLKVSPAKDRCSGTSNGPISTLTRFISSSANTTLSCDGRPGALSSCRVLVTLGSCRELGGNRTGVCAFRRTPAPRPNSSGASNAASIAGARATRTAAIGAISVPEANDSGVVLVSSTTLVMLSNIVVTSGGGGRRRWSRGTLLYYFDLCVDVFGIFVWA